MNTKRKLEDGDDSPPKHQLVGEKKLVINEFLNEYGSDVALFFYILPLDCRNYLCLFFGRHRGIVRNPQALRFSLSFKHHLSDAEDVCFDLEGNLVIVNSDQDDVALFDVIRGVRIGTIGHKRHSYPQACTVDSNGRYFISEWEADCVRVFNNHGEFEKEIGIYEPDELALSVDETLLYVVATSEIVSMIDMKNDIIIKQIEMTHPSNVTSLSTGQFVVTSLLSAFVHVFNVDFSVTSYPVETNGKLAVDAHDNIYMTHRWSHKFGVFTCDGSRIGNVYDVKRPVGIAISPSGLVVVCGRKRVTIFE